MPIIFLTALNSEPTSRSAITPPAPSTTSPSRSWVLRAKVSVFVDLYMKNRQVSEQAALLRSRLAQTPQPCPAARQPPNLCSQSSGCS